MKRFVALMVGALALSLLTAIAPSGVAVADRPGSGFIKYPNPATKIIDMPIKIHRYYGSRIEQYTIGTARFGIKVTPGFRAPDLRIQNTANPLSYSANDPSFALQGGLSTSSNVEGGADPYSEIRINFTFTYTDAGGSFGGGAGGTTINSSTNGRVTTFQGFGRITARKAIGRPAYIICVSGTSTPCFDLRG